ncbi:MAG: hypothetical protein RIS29_2443 [Bacteroidota bacterium]|jgi:hypothetical protein
MEKYNKFWLGLVPGLIIPALFMWAYLAKFFPGDGSIIDIVRYLFPSELMGKIFLLASMPNLAIVFVFYKNDSFKIAAGFMTAAMPYFITSIFLL